jgi:hypothetical protein
MHSISAITLFDSSHPAACIQVSIEARKLRWKSLPVFDDPLEVITVFIGCNVTL